MTALHRPRTLLLTVFAAGLEAAAMLVWAVLDFVRIPDAASLTTAIAGGLFFLLCAAGIGWCTLMIWRLESWSRAPLVLVQLIVLGLAWNLREDVVVAAGLALVAVIALVGIFAPPSIAALEEREV
ncbi:hypothetical protein J2S40_002851 [Nocardioides luteus]|uniref:Integral membrane protein n=1 Tax=Nocardioides luteus TaxID=1844 RepID=A0ABQ5SW11_9ACTN|nr:hypothetical protein [Nocardioides luteus]MDR7311793.1 hypothetical protein [Nocardioides luteus]GGR71875.1 hypothetical protein GCM10010197_44170 [Nocardioides luteus]GLJ68036.1 hypothetical protein GCM10017579_20720 [Nocardioides luteus]